MIDVSKIPVERRREMHTLQPKGLFYYTGAYCLSARTSLIPALKLSPQAQHLAEVDVRRAIWDEVYGDLYEDLRNMGPLLDFLQCTLNTSPEMEALRVRVARLREKLEPPR